MVDFQERDTRRTLGSDEGDAEEGDGGGDESASGPAAGDEAHETEQSAQPEDAGTAGHTAGRDQHAGRDHHAGHDHHAGDLASVSAAVLTVSTSRSIDEDTSGDAIVEVLEGAGHTIATRDVVNDDYDGVQSTVDRYVGREDVDAVVTTGGTGVSPADVTPEAVRPLFEKELPGFGEVFRSLSREEIGTRVIATRAVAGIADGVPVFCLPGSEDAVRLGTAEVVEPEVCHLAGLSCAPDAATGDSGKN
jgi:molybdenum cofactor biosynthesis protein B